MDPAIAGAIAGGTIGWGASLSTLLISNYRQQKRDEAQRKDEKRLLAGALSVELKGTRSNWRKLLDIHEKAGGNITLFASDEPYFSVFDGSGYRLYLLPQSLAEETVGCYLEAKGIMDRLRMEGRLYSQLSLLPSDERLALDKILQHRCKDVIAMMSDTLPIMDDMVEKLQAEAKGG